MAAPYLGEIRLFSFDFAPQGWAECNGQLLSIAQNAALFSLIGTFYGGDGVTTFALPDLQDRVAIHQGAGFVLAESGGESAHTLTTGEMANHGHNLNAGGVATTNDPKLAFFASPNVNARQATLYSTTNNDTAAPQAIQPFGGNQAHQNTQPSLVMNYSIALQGIYPS